MGNRVQWNLLEGILNSPFSYTWLQMLCTFTWTCEQKTLQIYSNAKITGQKGDIERDHGVG